MLQSNKKVILNTIKNNYATTYELLINNEIATQLHYTVT